MDFLESLPVLSSLIQYTLYTCNIEYIQFLVVGFRPSDKYEFVRSDY